MIKSKKSCLLRLVAICIVFLLVATTSTALFLQKYHINVETDKEVYYQGETVYVTGQLLKDGLGIAGGYCPKVLDPEHNPYWNPGLCYGSEPDGTFAFEVSISQGATPGTYTACVHGLIEAWEGWQNVTFEVIELEDVIAEANGPYEGLVDESIEFFGDASGGVPPYEWHWEFGNGDTSDEQNPTYVYDEAGDYVATLTVTDSMDTEGIDTADVNVSNPPNTQPDDPEIDGETDGKYKETYNYTIVTDDPEEQDVKYVVEWGDDETTETEYYSSGEEVVLSHSWDEKDTYTIRVKAIDEDLAESGWTELEVSMPFSRNIFENFLVRLLERFPRAFPILRSLIGI